MSGQSLGSRRSKFEIVFEILTMCGNGGTNKTAVMYRGNLSYEQLQRYLSLLCTQGLLEKNQAKRFQTTEKGKGFLEQAEGVMNFLLQLQEEAAGAVAGNGVGSIAAR